MTDDLAAPAFAALADEETVALHRALLACATQIQASGLYPLPEPHGAAGAVAGWARAGRRRPPYEASAIDHGGRPTADASGRTGRAPAAAADARGRTRS